MKRLKAILLGAMAAVAMTAGIVFGQAVIANFSLTWDNKYVPGFAASGLDIAGSKVSATAAQLNQTSQLTTTAGQTYTFPTTTATLARTDAANTFTGVQTFSSAPVLTGTIAADSAAAGKVGEYQEVNCGTPAASGTSVSFTNATPTVGTWTAHPFVPTGTAFGNFACPFTITANAPTGLSTSTNYWAVPIDANTFTVATSAANAAAGTFAATSGTSATANLTNSISLSTTAGLAPAVIKLTAGDWDCMGSAIRVLGATTSVTNMQTGLGSSSTAIGSLGSFFDFETAANVMTATNNPVHKTPLQRFNLSATTAEYLVALDTFTVSTDTVSGQIRCRRTR